ncbi:MAG: hypothetical protein NC452_09005 [Eubacterium sp.]|nr:hypothetical protein [Eubacterium sp.]
MNYDFDRLRHDLKDYIGTAGQFIPAAMSEMASVEYAAKKDLLKTARRMGFDIEDYEVGENF